MSELNEEHKGFGNDRLSTRPVATSSHCYADVNLFFPIVIAGALYPFMPLFLRLLYNVIRAIW